MRSYKIAAMGGDGIGPEVVEAGVQVLKVCAERDGRFTLDFQDFDWGSDYYRTHGVMMPDDGAERLESAAEQLGVLHRSIVAPKVQELAQLEQQLGQSRGEPEGDRPAADPAHAAEHGDHEPVGDDPAARARVRDSVRAGRLLSATWPRCAALE